MTAYIPLANITLGSAASTVTFGSIPSTYRDLVIVFSAFGSTTLEGRIRINGDTATNYHFQRLSGDGTQVEGQAIASETWGRISTRARATTSSRLEMKINIFEVNTGKMKMTLSRAGNSEQGVDLCFVRYAGLSAVTSVSIIASTGNWAAGTTAAIYGILA